MGSTTFQPDFVCLRVLRQCLLTESQIPRGQARSQPLPTPTFVNVPLGSRGGLGFYAEGSFAHASAYKNKELPSIPVQKEIRFPSLPHTWSLVCIICRKTFTLILTGFLMCSSFYISQEIRRFKNVSIYRRRT
jgi:hypothetical protein